MKLQTDYVWLEARPGSNYRQLFIKGRKIRAEILYHMTVNSEPLTAQEVADDYHIPVEAVLEAIHYSQNNEELLAQERERVFARLQSRGLIDMDKLNSRK